MRSQQTEVITAWIVGLVFLGGARYYGLDWMWSGFVGLLAMSAIASGSWRRG